MSMFMVIQDFVIVREGEREIQILSSVGSVQPGDMKWWRWCVIRLTSLCNFLQFIPPHLAASPASALCTCGDLKLSN